MLDRHPAGPRLAWKARVRSLALPRRMNVHKIMTARLRLSTAGARCVILTASHLPPGSLRTSTGLHYGILVVMVQLFHAPPVPATLCGFCFGGLLSYLLNRRKERKIIVDPIVRSRTATTAKRLMPAFTSPSPGIRSPGASPLQTRHRRSPAKGRARPKPCAYARAAAPRPRPAASPSSAAPRSPARAGAAAARRRPACLRPVDRIAEDRPAHRRAMDAQLVRTPGERGQRQRRVPPSPRASTRQRVCEGRPAGLHLHPPAARGVAARRAAGRSAPRRPPARTFDDGPVRLGDPALLEQQPKLLQRLAVAPEHQAARGVAVEPVRQRRARVAGRTAARRNAPPDCRRPSVRGARAGPRACRARASARRDRAADRRSSPRSPWRSGYLRHARPASFRRIFDKGRDSSIAERDRSFRLASIRPSRDRAPRRAGARRLRPTRPGRAAARRPGRPWAAPSAQASQERLQNNDDNPGLIQSPNRVIERTAAQKQQDVFSEGQVPRPINAPPEPKTGKGFVLDPLL